MLEALLSSSLREVEEVLDPGMVHWDLAPGPPVLEYDASGLRLLGEVPHMEGAHLDPFGVLGVAVEVHLHPAKALGLDTGGPTGGHLPGGIPDYTLFKQRPERLVGLIEAKSLQPDQTPRLRERARRQDQNVINAFEALRSPATHKPQAGRGDEETWATLKKANGEQLQAYVQELEMRAGYAVLTNGDAWWVYDLEKYRLGEDSQELANALDSETSALFDRVDKTVQTLDIIRYDRRWPGT